MVDNDAVGRAVDSRLRIGDVLLLAVLAAFVAAALELCVRAIQMLAFDQALFISRDAVWMMPLGQLLLFLPLALLLVLIGRLWRRAAGVRGTVLVFGFVALLGVALIPRLHWAAAVALALGGAYRLSTVAARRAQGMLLLARRAVPAMALVLATLAGLLAAGRAAGEWRAIRRLASAPANAPNVLLVIWDTVRSSSLSLYGYDQPTTPNLERLAERGVVFDRAIAPSPWTLPSHASIFTGQLPHRTSASWSTPLDDTHPTLAEVFRDAGYLTGAFAANVLYVDWEHGLDRGFVRFEDYRVTPGQIFITTSLGRLLVTGRQPWELSLPARLVGYRGFVGRKTAEMVDAAFLDWVDGREGRPFLAFLNYFDAHFPFDPPAAYEGRFGPRREEPGSIERIRRELAKEGAGDLAPEELAVELADYEAAIAYLDAQLGELVAELERRGVMDNTIVVVASDHGEEFREHGAVGHGGNLYLTQIGVPLVIAGPGVPEDVHVTEPVSLRDLPATITQLAGLEGDAFPGRSLAQTWRSADESEPEAVLAELIPGSDPSYRYRSVVLDRYQYIRDPRGGRELYDIVADPDQQRDLAPLPDVAFDVLRFDAIHDLLFRCREFDCCCALPNRPVD